MDSDDDRILGHVLESPEMTPDVRPAEQINERKPCVFRPSRRFSFTISEFWRVFILEQRLYEILSEK